MAIKKRFVNPCRKIGRNIRRERLRLGLTQAAVAQRCGLSPSTISSIELGKHPNMSTDNLWLVAGGLGVKASKLCVGC